MDIILSDLELIILIVLFIGISQKIIIYNIDCKKISNLINEALNKLPEREKIIIGARQLSDNTVTLEKLGKDLGISKERVRQLEGNALKKLKSNLQGKVNKKHYFLSVMYIGDWSFFSN